MVRAIPGDSYINFHLLYISYRYVVYAWSYLYCYSSNPSKPATLGTSGSVLIRGVATFQGMLWDFFEVTWIQGWPHFRACFGTFSKWPEYRGGRISGHALGLFRSDLSTGVATFQGFHCRVNLAGILCIQDSACMRDACNNKFQDNATEVYIICMSMRYITIYVIRR